MTPRVTSSVCWTTTRASTQPLNLNKPDLFLLPHPVLAFLRYAWLPYFMLAYSPSACFLTLCLPLSPLIAYFSL
jgi:hypothetical protein